MSTVLSLSPQPEHTRLFIRIFASIYSHQFPTSRCLPYCTEFGYYLLDGIDRWVNNVALIFVVWSEVSSATTLYRWKDIAEKTGLPAFVVYNVGFFGAQVLGISLAHGIGNPGAGAGAGIGLYFLMAIVAVVIARTPDVPAPSFWNRTAFTRKFWYLAFYSVSAAWKISAPLQRELI